MRKIAGYFPDDYIVYDLETTGLSVDKGAEVIEVSAVKVRNGEPTDEIFSELAKPHCGHIPDEVSDINHITDDMVANCRSVDDVMRDFFTFIGTEPLSGWNVKNFDNKFLRHYKKKLLNDNFHNPTYDGLAKIRENEFFMSQKEMGWKNQTPKAGVIVLPDFKLNTVAGYFGFVNQNAHRALSDVYTTISVNQCLKKHFLKHETKTRSTLSDIVDSMINSTLYAVGTDDGNIYVSTRKEDIKFIVATNKQYIVEKEGKVLYALNDDMSVAFAFKPYTEDELAMLMNLYFSGDEGLMMDMSQTVGRPLPYLFAEGMMELSVPQTIPYPKPYRMSEIMDMCKVNSKYLVYTVTDLIHNQPAIYDNKTKMKQALGTGGNKKYHLAVQGHACCLMDASTRQPVYVIKPYTRGEYSILKNYSMDTEEAIYRDAIGYVSIFVK